MWDYTAKLLERKSPSGNITVSNRLDFQRMAHKHLYGFAHDRDDIMVPEVPGLNLQDNTSVLDLLVARRQQGMTWRYPTVSTLRSLADDRQVSKEVLNGVPFRIVTLGVDENSHITSLQQWILNKFEAKEKLMPTATVPVKICMLKVSRETFIKVLDPEYAGEEVLVEQLQESVDSDYMYLPHKIAIGDGRTFMGVIQFFVLEPQHQPSDPLKSYIVRNNTIPDALLDFFEALPAVTNCGVEASMDDIRSFLQTARPDRVIKINDKVDLHSLAVLSGYAYQKISNTLLAFHILGGFYADIYTFKEHCLTTSWTDLNSWLKRKLLLNLRITGNIYLILFNVLLDQTFPDVSIVTSMTHTTPLEFIDYFGMLLVFTLDETKMELDGCEFYPSTLEDLYARVKRLPGYKTPERVKFFSKLWGPWPTIAEGGARYLIEVRHHFLSQYSSLQSALIPGFENLFRIEIDHIHRSYSRYGYTLNQISDLDFTKPLLQTGFFLQQHPDLEENQLVLDVDKPIPHTILTEESQRTSRDRRAMVEEWSRLNANRIFKLFKQLEKDEVLQAKFYPYYEAVRLTFRNLGTINPIGVEALDRKLCTAVSQEHKDTVARLHTVRSQMELLRKDEENLVKALEMMKEKDAKGFHIDRTAYRIPLRAVSTAKPLKWKMKRDKITQELKKKFRNNVNHQDETKKLANLNNWKDNEENKTDLPSTDYSRKRARSRSATRMHAHTLNCLPERPTYGEPTNKRRKISPPRSRQRSVTPRGVRNSRSRRRNSKSRTPYGPSGSRESWSDNQHRRSRHSFTHSVRNSWSKETHSSRNSYTPSRVWKSRSRQRTSTPQNTPRGRVNNSTIEGIVPSASSTPSPVGHRHSPRPAPSATFSRSELSDAYKTAMESRSPSRPKTPMSEYEDPNNDEMYIDHEAEDSETN